MGRHRTDILCALATLVLIGCRHSPQAAPDNYPDAVGSILLNKCATAGCHNQHSHKNAAGLNLSSWGTLFEGAASGAVVIPYRPDFSSLCYFINTDSSLGISLAPTMPLNMTPLSREEYLTITNWIAEGAPSAGGRVIFDDDPDRRKIYVTNRMCDVVTVMDAGTLLPMRYIDVGVKPEVEFPVCVKVSPDRKHWYVSFFSESAVVQKFDAANDACVGSIQAGAGSWTSFAISSDSRYGYFADNSYPGKIAYVDLEEMTLLYTFTYGGNLRYPTGIVVNEELNKIYAGAVNGNFIYSIDITDRNNWQAKEITVDGNATPVYHSSQNVTEMILSADGNLCYLVCEGTEEIKIVDMSTDELKATIPMGAPPSFIALAGDLNSLLVTCADDTLSFAGNRGSLKVVNLATQSVVKTLNTGYQPYGIAIENTRGVAAVANANISIKGPSSHHASRCGAKNGNVSFVDLKTFTIIPHKKAEVAVYPFGVATR